MAVQGNSGLCATCNNAATCFYRASRGPGLFCEMFDDYVAPGLRTVERANPYSSTSSVALHTTEVDAAAYPGLCMNCDHRRTCRHSRPATGIWHCGDYQ